MRISTPPAGSLGSMLVGVVAVVLVFVALTVVALLSVALVLPLPDVAVTDGFEDSVIVNDAVADCMEDDPVSAAFEESDCVVCEGDEFVDEEAESGQLVLA